MIGRFSPALYGCDCDFIGSPHFPPSIILVLPCSLHKTCARASLSNKIIARLSGPALLPGKSANTSVFRTIVAHHCSPCIAIVQAAIQSDITRHSGIPRPTALRGMPQAPCLKSD